MKKNLRIVSAAAAALLAVAPVAATVVPAASTTVNAEITGQPEVGKSYKTTAQINVNKELTDKVKVPNAVKYTGIQGQLQVYSMGKDNVTVTFEFNNQLHYAVISKDALIKNSNEIKGTQATKPAKPSASENITNNSSTVFDADANVAVNLSAVAGKDENGVDLPCWGSISGNIVATLDGRSYTGTISNASNGENVVITDAKGNVVKARELKARTPYTATFSNVAFNLGNAYSNKEVTLTLPMDTYFVDSKGKTETTKKFTADVNGVVNTGKIVVNGVYALDPTDMKGINFRFS